MDVNGETAILVVEDETFLRESLVEFLSARGHRAVGAATRGEAERLLEANAFRVLLLDVNLPDGSGLALARRLRAEGDGVGIIVLTARGTVADRVIGLDSGADAYLVKDADLLEIDATIRSVLRRLPVAAAPATEHAPATAAPTPTPTAPPATAGWTLATRSPVLQTPHGAVILLTASEHAFLLTLLRQQGEAVSRNAIAAGMARAPGWTPRNLDSLVRRLRQKVQGAGGMALPVRVVYGRGYSLDGAWSSPDAPTRHGP